MASPGASPTLEIHLGDNLEVLSRFEDGAFDLIYIDPPFNTGRAQTRTRLRTIRDEQGDRTGFQGKRYRTVRISGPPPSNDNPSTTSWPSSSPG